jgi:toxin ParE1/3/4
VTGPAIRFHVAASRELRAAAEWYDKRVPGLGDDLVDEVVSAVQRAMSHPDSGTAYLLDSRRIGIRRFPYSIVYLRRAHEVVVLALAHDRRRPGYWRSRQ